MLISPVVRSSQANRWPYLFFSMLALSRTNPLPTILPTHLLIMLVLPVAGSPKTKTLTVTVDPPAAAPSPPSGPPVGESISYRCLSFRPTTLPPLAPIHHGYRAVPCYGKASLVFDKLLTCRKKKKESLAGSEQKERHGSWSNPINAPRPRPVECSLVQSRAVQYSTVHYSTVQRRACFFLLISLLERLASFPLCSQ